jgi:hypothetical protein
MRILFRESGGIAGLDREIMIDGLELTVKDRGVVRLQKRLPRSELRRIAEVARLLQEKQPRRYYGRTASSDAMATSITISEDSELAGVEVIADTKDPPPQEFWSLADKLRGAALARASDPENVV